MNEPTLFRRADTGEEKEFAPASYRNDTTTNYSTQREYADFHFFRAEDGDRIDHKPDGSYQDKWGVVWVPV